MSRTVESVTPYRMTRGLYWKEIRLIIPLISMLFIVGLLLLFVWSVGGTDRSSQWVTYASLYLPLVLPALFAAGAGAILVGQEKETGTMGWFTAMPIEPRKIILSKTLVALAGLLLMWIGCGFLTLMAQSTRGTVTDVTSATGVTSFADRVFWGLHSLFLLACGFYTSWRLTNTFRSLLAIIPLAALPAIIIQVILLLQSLATGSWRYGERESAWLSTSVLLLSIVVVAYLAYRSAVRSLMPTSPPTPQSFSWIARFYWPVSGRSASPTAVPRTPFRYPISSLVWQMVHHNRLILTCLAAIMLLGVVCARLAVHEENIDSSTLMPLVVGGLVAGWFGVSWLGVFAFSGDGSAKRLRFLADRGVSPTRVWIGRHLVTLSLLCLISLIYTFVAALPLDRDDPIGVPPLSTVSFACLLLVIYSVSQWVGQTIRILAASAIVAPILSLVVAVLIMSNVMYRQTPLWILLVSAVLPLLATWWSMQRYMDDRAKWPMWVTGFIVAAVIGVAPIMQTRYVIATTPSLDSQTRAELLAGVREYPFATRTSESMMLAGSPDNRIEFYGDEVSSEVAMQDAQAYSLEPRARLQLGDSGSNESVPLAVDGNILSLAIGIATYAKLQVEQSPNDEAALELLSHWIDELTLIAKRLRRSERLIDQQAADVVEIWLTQTLVEQAMEPLRDRASGQAAIEMIADGQERSRARRRAILLSWADYEAQRPTFGGLSQWYNFDWVPPAQRPEVELRLIGAVASQLVRMIDAAENGASTDAIRKRLHELILPPGVPFGAGPYADRLRVGINDAYSTDQVTRYPAVQWYGPWETAAKQLGKHLKPKTEVQ